MDFIYLFNFILQLTEKNNLQNKFFTNNKQQEFLKRGRIDISNTCEEVGENQS